MQDNYKQREEVKVQWEYIVKLQVYQLQVYWYYQKNWLAFIHTSHTGSWKYSDTCRHFLIYREYIINMLSVLYETLLNFVTIVVRHDYRDYIGIIWNKY